MSEANKGMSFGKKAGITLGVVVVIGIAIVVILAVTGVFGGGSGSCANKKGACINTSGDKKDAKCTNGQLTCSDSGYCLSSSKPNTITGATLSCNSNHQWTQTCGSDVLNQDYIANGGSATCNGSSGFVYSCNSQVIPSSYVSNCAKATSSKPTCSTTNGFQCKCGTGVMNGMIGTPTLTCDTTNNSFTKKCGTYTLTSTDTCASPTIAGCTTNAFSCFCGLPSSSDNGYYPYIDGTTCPTNASSTCNSSTGTWGTCKCSSTDMLPAPTNSSDATPIVGSRQCKATTTGTTTTYTPAYLCGSDDVTTAYLACTDPTKGATCYAPVSPSTVNTIKCNSTT
jgi:hypothetical protein